MLTEKQAWARVAETLRERAAAGTHRGICMRILNLHDNDRISARTCGKMLDAVDRAKVRLKREPFPYLWPLDAEGHKKRIAFCLRRAK